MISKIDSIPSRSAKGLQGQDVLWTQFNEISFFIEDEFQENLYFQILKKIFPKVKLSKIFPLGGKPKVIAKAKQSIHNNKKVFIVDNDFDEILKEKEQLPNLFYLNRYSIENHFLEQDAIFELIREENPSIKLKDIRSKFTLSDFISQYSSIYAELGANLLLINKFGLGIKYLKIDPNRDCDLKSTPKLIKTHISGNFFNDCKSKLKDKYPRLKYEKQLNLLCKHFKLSKIIINIPGKYLINLLKTVLKKIFGFVQCTFETFVYRLVKNCNFQSLDYLKKSITLYTS